MWWSGVSILSLLPTAASYAIRMTQSGRCSSVPLEVGESIMGGGTAISSTAKTVQASQTIDDEVITLVDGGYYTPGVPIQISISNAPSQYLLEVNAAGLDGCSFDDDDHTRQAASSGSFSAPTDGRTLVLKAGWATGYNNRVKINSMSLLSPIPSSIPVPIPSSIPVPAPTRQPVLPGQPSTVPTSDPTAVPSLTPSVSMMPSLSTSPTLSAAPTLSLTPSVSMMPSLSTSPTLSAAPTLSLTPSVSTMMPSLSTSPTLSVAPTLSFAPTLTMSLAPTATDTVTAAVEMVLVATAAATSNDKSVLKSTIADQLDVDEASIVDLAISSDARTTSARKLLSTKSHVEESDKSSKYISSFVGQRRLQDYSWTVEFFVRVSLSSTTFSSSKEFSNNVAISLSSSEFAIAVTSSLASVTEVESVASSPEDRSSSSSSSSDPSTAGSATRETFIILFMVVGALSLFLAIPIAVATFKKQTSNAHVEVHEDNFEFTSMDDRPPMNTEGSLL